MSRKEAHKRIALHVAVSNCVQVARPSLHVSHCYVQALATYDVGSVNGLRLTLRTLSSVYPLRREMGVDTPPLVILLDP